MSDRIELWFMAPRVFVLTVITLSITSVCVVIMHTDAERKYAAKAARVRRMAGKDKSFLLN